MLEFLWSLPIGTMAADPRVPLAICCAVLAGLTRGFTGFGSALVYVPLMSALYSPQLAVAAFITFEVVVNAVMIPSTWRHVEWDRVLPMAAGGLVGTQFGVLILAYAEPIHLRWAISAIVVAAVVILATGWRYRGKPHAAVAFAIGILSGVLAGSVQVAGPPVIVYWLGSLSEPTVIRANFIGYFSFLSMGTFFTFAARGLLTPEAVAIGLLTGPAQLVATWAGTRLFHLASASTYRAVGYMTIGAVAIVSLPILDGLYR